MTGEQPTITVTINAINGEPMLDMIATAVLFGVDADQLTTHIRQQSPGLADGVMFNAKFPGAWLKAGRRRASEARAATGSSDFLDVLRYWAMRDLGANVVLEVAP